MTNDVRVFNNSTSTSEIIRPTLAARESGRSSVIVYPTGDSAGSTTQDTTELLGEAVGQLGELYKRMELVNTLAHISKAAGNYVQLRQEYRFVPVLIDSGNHPIPLFQFIEVMDGQIDYGALKEEFPGLSYSQIDGAIQFLKKVAQINSNGVDLGNLEDEIDLEDDELVAALRASLADQENARVLFDDKQDR